MITLRRDGTSEEDIQDGKEIIELLQFDGNLEVIIIIKSL